jgi:signal transduction histidine kinase
MKVEQLAYVLKCNTAIGSSLDLHEMLTQCIRVFVRESSAIYGQMELTADVEEPMQVSHGKLPIGLAAAVGNDEGPAVQEVDGHHVLRPGLRSVRLVLVFREERDFGFYGAALGSLANRLEVAVEACLSHERMARAKNVAEHAQRQLGRSFGLLQAVAQTIDLLLGQRDYLTAMADGLASIGKATQVDRCYLFVNTLGADEDTSTTSQRVEWTSDGIAPEIDNPELQGVPFSAFPEMMRPLAQGGEFCELVRDLPDGGGKEVLAAQGILSILALPVVVSGRFWGLVGFDDCTTERVWTQQERDVLRSFAGSLARAVERISAEESLQEAEEALRAMNATLEQRVEQRTAELNAALDNLTLAQEEMIRQEKMASIGQLVAGIAHELNTPLGAINASATNLRSTLLELFKKKIPEGDMDQLLFTCSTADSIDVGQRLTSREERTLVNELGHHIRERFPAVVDVASISRQLAECGLRPESDDATLRALLDHPRNEARVDLLVHMMRLRRAIGTIGMGSEKAAKVIRALKAYLHTGSEEMAPVNLQQNISHVLTLYAHEMRKGIVEEISVADTVWVMGNQDELGQVWSNIIGNAIHAMHYEGVLTIRARYVGDMVEVAIGNNGPRIPEANLGRLFDLMFTTKPLGHGTGIGLSIVKRVVDAHGGAVQVSSDDENTVFTVTLPKAKT